MTAAERRIFGPAAYPLSGSGLEITSALERSKAVFQEPNASGGNATKRIEVSFSPQSLTASSYPILKQEQNSLHSPGRTKTSSSR